MASAERRIIVEKYPELFDNMDPNYKDMIRKQMIWEKIGQTVDRTGGECMRKWKNIRDAFCAWRKKKQRFGEQSKKVREYIYARDLKFIIPFIIPRSPVFKPKLLPVKIENGVADWARDEEVSHNNTESQEVSHKTESQEVSHDMTESQEFSHDMTESQEFSHGMTESQQDNDDCDNYDSTVDSQVNYDSITAPAESPPLKSTRRYRKRKKKVDREDDMETNERIEKTRARAVADMDETESFFFSMGQTVKRLPPHVQAGVKISICQTVMEADMQNITAKESFSVSPQHEQVMSTQI